MTSLSSLRNMFMVVIYTFDFGDCVFALICSKGRQKITNSVALGPSMKTEATQPGLD